MIIKIDYFIKSKNNKYYETKHEEINENDIIEIARQKFLNRWTCLDINNVEISIDKVII